MAVQVPSKVYNQFDQNISMKQSSSHSKAVCSLKIEERLLSHNEAADYLRLSPKALYNLCSLGHIKYLKVGRRNRFLYEDLRTYALSEPRGDLNGNNVS